MWVYQQSTGKMSDCTGSLVGIGYSGFEQGKNNPDMQEIHSIGPLPRGLYDMTELFDSTDHGPCCIRLMPRLDTEMFGRDGMLCHGDSIIHEGMASHGCVIQLRTTRQRMWDSGDHLLEVIE